MPSIKEEKIASPNSPESTANFSKIFILSGIALLAMSLFFLAYIFSPLISSEIGYRFSKINPTAAVETKGETFGQNNNQAVINPKDENFGIVIPKINANAKVIADVDPNNSREYQKALTQGVAQAQGSAYPGEPGNIFIFAHSGQDLAEANRYNAVFYLLGKLEPGDVIYIFYQGQKIRYAVAEKKVVAASDIQYLSDIKENNTLTLMTCWPAGTTWKRLIVIADQLGS